MTRFTLLFALLLAIPATALAWDEASDGELSQDPASPTPVSFALGSNTVAGSVMSSGDPRDCIRFTIPAGQRLVALRQISWTSLPGGGAGNRGFHALDNGPSSVIADATNEGTLLGGDHMDALASGTDMLPELSDGDTAGAGFSVPVGPGTYTYQVQQTSSLLTGYSLQFELAAASSTPVPAVPSWAIVLAVALLLCGGTFWSALVKLLG